MPTSISDRPDLAHRAVPGAGTPCAGLKAQLADEARRLGFAGLRITTPEGIGSAGERLMAFLDEGRHGDMAWMAAHAARRRDPKVLWPEARTIVMLAMSYKPDGDPLDALDARGTGAISVYAQGRDYHDIVKARLKTLAGWLKDRAGGAVKVFADTAPLMEKPLAAAAGLGWQGKHTNLVSRELGSWFFLGAILSTEALEPDAPEIDHCGSCRRCLDICPTGAFPSPYQLDARRCLSYLTIEYKGHIAHAFRKPMRNRIYGCDDCLAVCPWNKFATAARDTMLAPRAAAANPPLAELLALDDAGFRARFSGSPIKRTGRDRFLRNVLIGAGNSTDSSLVPHITRLLADASPLVRAMAVWALRELAGPRDVAAERARHLDQEFDEAVRAEWLVQEGT